MSTPAEPLKRWRITTRVTASRIYFVDAPNAKTAEAISVGQCADHEQDDNEETLEIIEIPGVERQ